jgi:hypothetical protein
MADKDKLTEGKEAASLMIDVLENLTEYAAAVDDTLALHIERATNLTRDYEVRLKELKRPETLAQFTPAQREKLDNIEQACTEMATALAEFMKDALTLDPEQGPAYGENVLRSLENARARIQLLRDR